MEERDFPRNLRRRSSTEDRYLSLSSGARRASRQHGSTRLRRRKADGISCSRISINQVTMRPSASPRCQAARNRRVEIANYPSPWRDAPRRAVLRFRVAVYHDGSGKGGNAAGGFYRSRDRRHARFRRPTSPVAAEGGRESGRRDDEGTILRHDVASLHSGFARNCSPRSAVARSSFSPPLTRYIRDRETLRINLHGRETVYRNTFSGRRSFMSSR